MECEFPINYNTLVWYNITKRIWWPAKVMDPNKIPNHVTKNISKKQKSFGIVLIQPENKYYLIENKSQVVLYSGPNKMNFIEKGYNKMIGQKKIGKKTPYDMSSFVDIVLQCEEDIGGNLNIFTELLVQIEETQRKQTAAKILTKVLFSPDKKGKKSFTPKAPAEFAEPTELEELEEPAELEEPVDLEELEEFEEPVNLEELEEPVEFKELEELAEAAEFAKPAEIAKPAELADLEKLTEPTEFTKLFEFAKLAEFAKPADTSNIVKSTEPEEIQKLSTTITTEEEKYRCLVKKGCHYKTNNYGLLRNHMQNHYIENKDNNEMVKIGTTTTSDKQSNKKKINNITNDGIQKETSTDLVSINKQHELLLDNKTTSDKQSDTKKINEIVKDGRQEETSINVISTNEQHECLLDSLPMPGWAKENNWYKSPENGLEEARIFTTRKKNEKLVLDLPPMETQPHYFKTKYIDNLDLDESKYKYITVRVPINQQKNTDGQIQNLNGKDKISDGEIVKK